MTKQCMLFQFLSVKRQQMMAMQNHNSTLLLYYLRKEIKKERSLLEKSANQKNGQAAYKLGKFMKVSLI